jgi:hypothetical protein
MVKALAIANWNLMGMHYSLVVADGTTDSGELWHAHKILKPGAGCLRQILGPTATEQKGRCRTNNLSVRHVGSGVVEKWCLEN